MPERYRTSLGELILGDAREILKQIPSESVDAVITDPPWGVGYDQYDDFQVFLDVVPEIHRVLKRDAWFAVYIATKRILDLRALLDRFNYKWAMPVVFLNEGGTRGPLGVRTSFSMVFVFAKGRPKVYEKHGDLLIGDELPGTRKLKFREAKPTFPTAILLRMFTREGDLVLDPFAGYGSIPLACELTGRRWIGVEIDPAKFESARKIIGARGA